MSTPAKKSSYSYTGHTTIHGRVVIERRRSLEADKNEKNRRMILVDATFYLHNTERTTADSLPCIFKYFQQSDDEFNEKNDPEVFDISANIILMPVTLLEDVEKAIVCMDYSAKDYAVLGDITRLNPIGLVSEGYELQCRPLLSLAGTVTSVNETARIIEVSAEPWVSLCKMYPSIASSCRLQITVPDTKRWSTFPKVSIGDMVTIDAFGVSLERNAKGDIKHICVELEKISYQGRARSVVKPPATPSPSTSNGVRKAAFNFGDSPAPKRRRTENSS